VNIPDEHLRVLRLNIAILRAQIAALIEQPDRERNRLFFLRELFSSEMTYHALVRKRRQQLAVHAVGA
jgi:hypothetical protein